MADWLITVVTALVSAILAAVGTQIGNWIWNRPSKKRKAKEEEEAKRKAELEELETKLTAVIEGIKGDYSAVDETTLQRIDEIEKKFDNITARLDYLAVGLQVTIKDTLKTRYLQWIEKGYTPLDVKEDLEKMYQAYHKLGANGVMDDIRKQYNNLPIGRTIDEAIENSKKNTDKRKK